MTYEELQKENRRFRKIIKDSSDIDVDLLRSDEIILSGGTIRVNLDGLDYMTRESFK
jgi:hypothetical protein